jgi:uncharacterized protein YlzI (FlbEa/FlbD family)
MNNPRSKCHYLFFIWICLAVLIGNPRLAYSVVGAVEVVAGQEGKPVPEATITILQQNEVITEERTDNNGVALIPLEEGDYTIVIKSPDKAVQRTITVEPGKLLSLTGNFAKGVISVNKEPIRRYRPLEATDVKKGYSVFSADLDGLMSYRFDTPQGSIFLGFPYYTSQGETISWNAMLVEAGANSREKRKNLKKMKDYIVSVNGEKFLLKGTTIWKMTAVVKANITLLSKDGKKTFIKLSVNFRFQDVPSSDKLTLSTAGWPVFIRGEFDGIAENTQARFGGSPIEVMAETHSCAIINPPRELVGMQEVIINEAGRTTEAVVRNVHLELYADRLNLHRGEKTQVHLNILGLEGMEKPAYAHLYNLSPSIVTMSGGHAQFFIIEPSEVGPGGIASYDRNLVGIRRGDFVITAMCFGGGEKSEMDKAKEEAERCEKEARKAEKEFRDLEKDLEGKVKKPWNRLRKWRELKKKAEEARAAAEAAKDKVADILVRTDEGRDWEKEAEEARKELERVERKLGGMPKERFKAWIDANKKLQDALRNLRAARRKMIKNR